ncbi:IS200/IS605 family transposase [Algoriphagus sediminis]|uniref:IS200/IS605 family transposase n=1 Tax=Algoriphagus sediminis TaxID=3057113 RepID=A0ABT7YFE2_9BACT|nr:IS200/IS605 family transposase [Algoriphagus sediminis]MDN3205213.1 IS200/IS605 family transposase [Algoriphagus sediminis]
MANTYTQVYIQLIFVVKFRKALIESGWEERLFKYMIGIIHQNGHKVLAINGMPDHLHILISMKPVQSISDLAQKVKSSSSKWINENGLARGKFAWQTGYAGFSYTKSHVDRVVKYIANQKAHHTKTGFQFEYKRILDELGIEYKEEYLFKSPE